MTESDCFNSFVIDSDYLLSSAAPDGPAGPDGDPHPCRQSFGEAVAVPTRRAPQVFANDRGHS